MFVVRYGTDASSVAHMADAAGAGEASGNPPRRSTNAGGTAFVAAKEKGATDLDFFGPEN